MQPYPQHVLLLWCMCDGGSGAMSAPDLLRTFLQASGCLGPANGACVLVMWCGRAADVLAVGGTCRSMRFLARILCFWCGCQHDDLGRVASRIFPRGDGRGTRRPVEQVDQALFLSCCLPCLLLLTDPRVHRETHRWCRHCEQWVGRNSGCEHEDPFDPGSDSS